MHVAPKHPDLKDLAIRLLALTDTLREQPRVLADLLDAARELADQGEIDLALTILRVVKLDRLRVAAAKSLKAELRSIARSRTIPSTLTRRW